MSDGTRSAAKLLDVFLVTFALSLISFSYANPVVKFLLIRISAAKDVMTPTVKVLKFTVTLTLPFALFTLFPS